MDLLVTADDFGMSPSINMAVAQSMVLGYASHTSVLVTAEGFQEACELARAYSFEDRVGLHFNLTWGAPLTEPMRRNPRFCREGLFTPLTRAKMLVPIVGAERRVVADEARAQIKRAREHGLPALHLDSHNHCHISPNLATILVRVAKDADIRRVRLARNAIPGTSALSRLFKAGYNAWLRHQGLTRIRHFGTVEELVRLAEQGRLVGPAEVMIHPILTENGLTDAAAHKPLGEYLAPLTQYGDCSLSNGHAFVENDGRVAGDQVR